MMEDRLNRYSIYLREPKNKKLMYRIVFLLCAMGITLLGVLELACVGLILWKLAG